MSLKPTDIRTAFLAVGVGEDDVAAFGDSDLEAICKSLGADFDVEHLPGFFAAEDTAAVLSEGDAAMLGAAAADYMERIAKAVPAGGKPDEDPEEEDPREAAKRAKVAAAMAKVTGKPAEAPEDDTDPEDDLDPDDEYEDDDGLEDEPAPKGKGKPEPVRKGLGDHAEDEGMIVGIGEAVEPFLKGFETFTAQRDAELFGAIAKLTEEVVKLSKGLSALRKENGEVVKVSKGLADQFEAMGAQPVRSGRPPRTVIRERGDAVADPGIEMEELEEVIQKGLVRGDLTVAEAATIRNRYGTNEYAIHAGKVEGIRKSLGSPAPVVVSQ